MILRVVVKWRVSSSYSVLVILAVLAFLEIAESCHRRVEYHHFYKKKPPPHHHGSKGHGHGHGHGGGYGHHGGHGYGKGHGKGKGYGHGHDHGGGGYHGGEGHHGGGHEGYGHGHHMSKGHGHGHGYGDDGYGGGGDHYDQGYKGDHGHGYGGHGGHDDGYHMMGGHGQGHGYDNYGGHHGMDYMPHEGGHGHKHGGKGKGRKYKFQMYESMTYDDKGGHHHQPSHGHGQNQGHYSHNTPHYMQKGYGYSGPYPNTEYSTPIETSVLMPSSDHEYDEAIGFSSPPGSSLDAADTAEVIRNTKANNDGRFSGFGDFQDSGQYFDSRGSTSELSSSDILPTGSEKMEALTGEGTGSEPESAKVDPATVGNFDLNLNFSPPGLPPSPFRRNFVVGMNNSTIGRGRGRRRKKMSSRFRQQRLSGIRTSGGDQVSKTVPQEGQGSVAKGGSDYLHNDTTGTGAKEEEEEAKKPPEFIDFMNF